MTFPDCSDAPASRAVPLPLGRRTARPRLLPALLAALFAAAHPLTSLAFDPFTVRDIRVEGVQRTEAGTIFSYLPIKVGEQVNDEKIAHGGQGAVRDRVLP